MDDLSCTKSFYLIFIKNFDIIVIENKKGNEKMDRSDLAIRMKENYEKRAQTKLIRRMPVAIRIDGKAFHTFTCGFREPFDKILMQAMQETMLYLCENIQGCVFGYTQSDEITLILIDYQTFETEAWFDYEVQKMCSMSASMATMAFNKYFTKNVEYFSKSKDVVGYNEQYFGDYNDAIIQLATYEKAIEKGAMFDARCFNIPKEEVTNLIYWRQLDAIRNSIQMVGQANFSHQELQNKTCNMIQDMLHEQKGINWNDFPIPCKRGTACVKTNEGFYIDYGMPILKGKNRQYVDSLIDF